MATTTSPAVSMLRGAEWLLKSSDPSSVFTPERLSEEHHLIAQTVSDFVNQEVLPQLDRLEQKDWALSRRLVHRAGELGFHGVDVAEEYGGLQLDKATSLIVSERMSQAASFGATFGAHANLMVLPLSLFGTDAQKRKYLPPLIAGDLVGAYCLSEAGSGSDALGAKTRAVKQDDGSFVLNGAGEERLLRYGEHTAELEEGREPSLRIGWLLVTVLGVVGTDVLQGGDEQHRGEGVVGEGQRPDVRHDRLQPRHVRAREVYPGHAPGRGREQCRQVARLGKGVADLEHPPGGGDARQRRRADAVLPLAHQCFARNFQKHALVGARGRSVRSRFSKAHGRAP